MTPEKRSNLIVLFMLSVLAFGTGAGHAQQRAASPPPTRVPVTIALVDTLPAGREFLIVRRTDVAPRDLILMRSSADANTLSAAVLDLLQIRAVQGDTASVQGTVRIRPRAPTRGSGPRVLPWAARVIGRLKSGPVREVAGIGNVRAVEIWLPPQRGRARR